jgi:hypothetical protein
LADIESVTGLYQDFPSALADFAIPLDVALLLRSFCGCKICLGRNSV